MANTSATGGYLAPSNPSPPEDDSLDDIFQAAIVGTTGMDGAYVRPRWQPNTPKQPDPSVDWCAFGVNRRAVQDFPSIQHFGTGQGRDELSRHEDIELLATFYGPNAQKFAMLLRDGLYVPQNIEILKSQGVSFVDCGDLTTIPEIFNLNWIKRFDLKATFRRKVTRVYPVLNIAAADVHLFDDSGRVDETIAVPPAP